MSRLSITLEQKLTSLAAALISQQQARVIVPPQAARSGFWFGGGNLVEGPDDRLYLVGRYRNHGDSRSGLAAGQRGLELTVFRSDDLGRSFQPLLRFSKEDLSAPERPVLSIEGSALWLGNDHVELFVSTEKEGVGYPDQLSQYLKPGTGVWTIDVLRADSVEQLAAACPQTVFQSDDPEFLHVKDPLVYRPAAGDEALLFCTHPFCWSSSNTAFAKRPVGSTEFAEPEWQFFPRGTTWDVAMTRVTAVVDVPRRGAFHDLDVSLLFYDGGECVRDLDEHAESVRRPRGYSCEELGGAAYFVDGRLDQIHRLSRHFPLFVSPHGTGSSRYVDVLTCSEGMLATWQQSQPDQSQPLVLHSLDWEQVDAILN